MLLTLKSPVLRSLLHIVPMLGIVALAILWVGIEHNHKIRRDAAYSTAKQNTENMARVLEEHVIRSMQEADKTLLMLRAAYLHSPINFDMQVWASYPSFRTELAVQYALIGRDGLLLSSNVGAPNSRVDLSDREHFRVHVDRSVDELFISKPVVGRQSGKWSIQLSRAIRDSEGHFLGVLVSSIDPYHFSRFYESVDLGLDGDVTLAGFDGVIRARSGNSPDTLGRSIAQSEVFTAHLTSPKGTILATGVADDTRRLISYRAVKGYPLIVMAGMAEREIFAASLSEHTTYHWLGGAMSVSLVIFTAVGLANRMRLERTLHALEVERDHAQRANRAKSTFLAIMSHEIRTPLNAILGLTSVLLEESVAKEQSEKLIAIQSAGDGLLDILNDILDYSKMEAGEISLEHMTFDPRAVVESAVLVLGPKAASKGLAVNVSFDEAIPAYVVGDLGRLRQVMINLVSNAIKFTSTGQIEISSRLVRHQDAKHTIEWTVSDSGMGIPPDRLARLFEDFVQADNTIHRRFGGSGLGLAICKRIVTAMGGTIAVSSRLQQGTTVRFTVELSEGAPASLPTSERSDAKCSNESAAPGQRLLRILIADDNPTNRLVATKFVEPIASSVVAVGDGVEAVRAALEAPFDVIIMDVRMPEMDGLTATKELRTKGCTTPILAFTANAYREDIDACKAAGMTGFVPKPVRKEALVAEIERVLSTVPDPSAAGTASRPASNASVVEHRLVDHAELATLAAEIGEAGMRDALSVFAEETGNRLTRMRGLRPATDHDVIRREAHSIKGTSATFGFVRLSELARNLERSVTTITARDYDDALAALQSTFIESLETLDPQPIAAHVANAA